MIHGYSAWEARVQREELRRISMRLIDHPDLMRIDLKPPSSVPELEVAILFGPFPNETLATAAEAPLHFLTSLAVFPLAERWVALRGA